MGFSSYSRLRAGIFEPTHTISAPVVSQAIDLRGLTRPKRGQAVAAGGNTAATGIAGLGDITDAVIAAARGPRTAQQQQGNQPQQQSNTEQARQQMQDSTLKAHLDQAESMAARPTQRHGIAFPEDSKYNGAGSTATSTAATRWAGGPLGSFGEPSGSLLGNTPGTFDAIAGSAF